MPLSDGLLAELENKMGDGTPRGMVWPLLANLALSVAHCVVTDEEAEAMNELLVVLIADADERAVDQLEIQMCLAQLRAYLDRKKP